MDLILMTCVAIALLVTLITILLLKKKTTKEPELVRVQEGRPFRAQIERNQRHRLGQGTVRARNAHLQNGVGRGPEVSDDDVTDVPKGPSINEKIGSKKRAKVEAKEQKRIVREQELIEREKQKEKDAKMEEERKRLEKQLAEEENRKIEAERLAREEQDRKDHEEYIKLKAYFNVEEEGFEDNETDKQELLNKFVQFIKDNKVVVLEDLSSEFKLKTQQVICKIQELQNIGLLTGVIDDRGKFIYISEDELRAVAKFITLHGRVSIAELAESSNHLIGLMPIISNT